MTTSPRKVEIVQHDPSNGAPSRAQVRATFEWSRDEILLGRNALRPKFHRLEDAVATLVDAFIDGRHAEIMRAAEIVHAEAADVTKTANQISGLAQSLVTGTHHQLIRRPRV